MGIPDKDNLTARITQNFPGFDFVEAEPVDKGWSNDRKFRVVDSDGNKFLLRLAGADKYNSKKREFDYMRRVEALGVRMCGAVKFGEFADGVYLLVKWVDGCDAEDKIPLLADECACQYGLTSGEYLSRIHSVPAPDNVEDWAARFNRKIDRNIKLYGDCSVKFDGAGYMLDYIAANRSLLCGRPRCFQHGDYHIGNMMLADGELVIIDFNRCDFGDPWEEFNRIVWCVQKCPAMASGMIDGYFKSGVPEKFWQLLALYISSNTLASVPWAMSFGQQDVQVMKDQAACVLRWYDNMNMYVPNWYTAR